MVGIQIRRIALASVVPGAVIDGPVIFNADLGNEIDNMEGIDAHVTPEGETVLLAGGGVRGVHDGEADALERPPRPGSEEPIGAEANSPVPGCAEDEGAGFGIEVETLLAEDTLNASREYEVLWASDVKDPIAADEPDPIGGANREVQIVRG